jgi:hypothetical protein
MHRWHKHRSLHIRVRQQVSESIEVEQTRLLERDILAWPLVGTLSLCYHIRDLTRYLRFSKKEP